MIKNGSVRIIWYYMYNLYNVIISNMVLCVWIPWSCKFGPLWPLNKQAVLVVLQLLRWREMIWNYWQSDCRMRIWESSAYKSDRIPLGAKASWCCGTLKVLSSSSELSRGRPLSNAWPKRWTSTPKKVQNGQVISNDLNWNQPPSDVYV